MNPKINGDLEGILLVRDEEKQQSLSINDEYSFKGVKKILHCCGSDNGKWLAE